MFDSLKDKLQDVFSALGKRGALRESDVDAALREVRLALLDVPCNCMHVTKSTLKLVKYISSFPQKKLYVQCARARRQTRRLRKGDDPATPTLGPIS